MPIDVNTYTAQQQAAAIYVAYYDRAPDPAGLVFWTNEIEAGLSLEEVATSFSNAAETKAKYPYFDTPELSSPNVFLTSVYLNLFNRLPDSEGLEFWSKQLETGSTDVGEIILAIIEGAQGDDIAVVENKVEVGLDWAASAADAGVGGPSNLIATEVDGELVVYNEAAWASAGAVLDDVDATAASVSVAQQATDAFFAGEGISGEVFTLTEGTDIIDGTAADDLILAGTSNTGLLSGNTLGSGDVIDGGEGLDTLRVTDGGSLLPGGTLTPNLTSVERVEVQALGVTPTNLNLINANGVEQIWNVDSTANVVVTEINDDAVLGFQDTDTDIDADFDDDAIVDGAVDVAIDGSNSNLTVTANSTVDTLNILATGEASTLTVDVDDAAITTVTIAGDAELAADLTAETDVSSLTIDNTAGAEVRLGSNDADLTVIGGAGDDTIFIDADNLDGDDEFLLGAGEDRLELRFGTPIDLTSATNGVVQAVNNSEIETLVLDLDLDDIPNEDIALDASLFTTVDDFVLTNSVGGIFGDITVTEVMDEDTFRITESVSDTAGAGGTVSFDAADDNDVLNLTAEGDIETLVATDFDVANLDLANTTDFDLLVDMDAGTTLQVTGEDTASVTFEIDTLASGTTVDLSALTTDGDIDVTYTSGAATTVDITDANFLVGNGGDDRLIGTDQDDVLDGDQPTAGVSQVTNVDLGDALAIDEGDIYRVTINGVTVEYEAAAGDTDDQVEAGLVAAINANGTLGAAGITAALAADGFDITGNADGSAFTVATGSENATLTREVQTIDFGTTNFDGRTVGGTDEGDTLTINVNGVTVTTTLSGDVDGTEVSPQAAAAALATAIVATPALAGQGITASASGGVLSIFGEPDGSDLTVTLNATDGVIDANDRDDIEAVYTTGTVAGDVVNFSVQGVDFQFVSTGDEDADAQTIVNLVNSSTALTNINAVLDDEFTGGGDTPDIAIIASTDGTDVDLTATVTGLGSTTIVQANGAPIDTDGTAAYWAQAGDAVNNNALGSPVTAVEGNPAGADVNPDFVIDTTQEGVAAVGTSADVFTGNGGVDIFVAEGAAISASGADTITDFTSGEDLIDFAEVGSAGTAANYSEGPSGGFGNFAGALTQAQSDFQANGNLEYVAHAVGNDVYVFAADNFATDGIDDVVQLTGVSLADLNDSGNFIVA